MSRGEAYEFSSIIGISTIVVLGDMASQALILRGSERG